MWLVDRHTLMTLPEGTLYFNESEADRSLMVKGSTLTDRDGTNIDWAEMRLCAANPAYGVPEPSDLGDSCFFSEDNYGRNGSYDDEDRFIVYQPHDLELLKKFVEKAILVSKGSTT